MMKNLTNFLELVEASVDPSLSGQAIISNCSNKMKCGTT